MSHVPAGDIAIPLGDFNAKVGRAPANVCGTQSLHAEESDNGARLADFASRNNLVIRSTMFARPKHVKVTWRAPDHILVSDQHKASISHVTSIPEANCGSDHALVCATLYTNLAVKKAERPKKSPPKRYNVERLRQEGDEDYENTITALLMSTEEPDSINDKWSRIESAVHTAAKACFGLSRPTKDKPWYDEECDEVVQHRKRKWAELLAEERDSDQLGLLAAQLQLPPHLARPHPAPTPLAPAPQADGHPAPPPLPPGRQPGGAGAGAEAGQNHDRHLIPRSRPSTPEGDPKGQEETPTRPTRGPGLPLL